MAGGNSAAALRIESWSLPIDAVDRWLKSAKPGDTLIYAHGPVIIDAELAAYMNGLAAAKDVHLHPRRAACGGLDRIAIRNRVRVTLPPRPRAQPGLVLDPAMSALFLKLKAVARMKERCPSDKALGQALGITSDQVKWAMRKLVAAGLVHTRMVPTSAEPKYRVVTIVSTGLETRLPIGCAK